MEILAIESGKRCAERRGAEVVLERAEEISQILRDNPAF
jgi:hypothetical protein